jgi:hypothetical protein
MKIPSNNKLFGSEYGDVRTYMYFCEKSVNPLLGFSR